MQLTEPKVIKEVLSKNGFTFKKSLGQNFLINPAVCPQMADSAAACGEDAVIEIGPGIGVLTVELAKRVKNVVSIELDERLKPVLSETLSGYNNTEIIFGDVMKLDLKKIIYERFEGKKVSICANLPYYITSPIIMSLLESRLPVTSVTVMVQREAAQRICAAVGSRESGAVTVAVNYYSCPEILFGVSRGSFMPQPNVDSSVIRLTVLDEPPIKVADENYFFKFVRSSFGKRRKTLVNSAALGCGIEKEIIKKALISAKLPEDIRAEKLTMSELGEVFNSIYSTL